MKTIILATAAALSIGAGAAFAGEGEGTTANTYFTELPGVVATAPVQVPGAVAANGAQTHAFVTQQRGAVSLFPANENQGSNS
jgi:hypothetical protein